MSKITEGEVELTLDGEPVTLKPTLNAATRIARHFGGFQQAFQRVKDMDLDSVVLIIRCGLSLSDTDAKTLPDKVFRAGLLDLVGPVSDYVLRLANGGRPLEPSPASAGSPAGDS